MVVVVGAKILFPVLGCRPFICVLVCRLLPFANVCFRSFIIHFRLFAAAAKASLKILIGPIKLIAHES